MIINLPNQFDLTIPFFIYWSIVFFNMNVERLNIYKRLRDFKVPSTVLDNIFSDEDDIKTLEVAFRALVEDGFKEDDAAKEISKMIFKELDLSVDDYQEEEK